MSAAEFMLHAQVNFCRQCRRMVHDFTQSKAPSADLADRAAAPDWRVCGTFRRAQVQALPGFTLGRQNGKPVPVSLTVPVIFN
jgi:hypothetical protein